MTISPATELAWAPLAQVDPMQALNPTEYQVFETMKTLLKYSLIVVASVPVLLMYPLAQKYFVKGVMLGSLKE